MISWRTWSIVILGFVLALIGVAQPSSAQEPQLDVCLNIFIVGGTASFLARNPEFPTPEALLGRPGEQANLRIPPTIQRVNDVWSQCHIGFALNVVAVVAADRLILSGDRTFLERRQNFASYPNALRVLANRALPSLERVYRCLNLFIVDRLPGFILGIAELPVRPGSVIGAVQWRLPSETPVETIAHELGHNLGLQHVGDRENLMFPIISGGFDLTARQCRTARAQARNLQTGRPPQILDLIALEEIPVGGKGEILIIFRDRDLDLAVVGVGQARLVDGRLALLPDRRITPDVKGSITGVIRVPVRCGAAGRLWVSLFLIDELGRSARASLELSCRLRS
jgi:hypothetical protein